MSRSRLISILKAAPFADVAAIGLALLLLLVPVALLSARERARQDVFAWSLRERGAQSSHLETEPRLLEVGAELPAGLERVLSLPPRPDQCAPSTVEIERGGRRIRKVFVNGVAAEAVIVPGIRFDRVDPIPGELRLFVPITRIPEHVVSAVIATEDRRFFRHGGVDARAMLRALIANTRARGRVQGGSTITQQLAKNVFLDSDRTLERKLREIFLAVALEEAMTKRQLLEAYLNEIDFGRAGSTNVVGIGSAALTYFAKPVECLDLAESAVLAGIIRAPNRLSPARHPERARARAARVLAAMKRSKLASEEELAAADPGTVTFAVPDSRRTAPYFSDFVREEMAKLTGHRSPARTVHTTIDLEIQKAAQRALAAGLAELDEKSDAPLDGAVVVLEAASGKIRAMVGGRDYHRSQFNRAARAERQVGSVAKPFVALAALRNEHADTSTLLLDEPIVLPTRDGPWAPRNVDRLFRGPVTLHAALAHSVNVPFVRLSQEIGLFELAAMLRDLGLRRKGDDVYPSLALGAFEATPLRIAAAFAAIANGGTWIEPHAIERVLDADGVRLFEHAPARRKIASREAAYQVFAMMRAAVNGGTAYRVRSLGYRHDVAGKTGTTDETRDGWFVGMDAELVTVVWIGADDPLSTGLLAGDGAVPIWTRLMAAVRKVRPPPVHPAPLGLRTVHLCDETGKIAASFCPHVSRVAVRRTTELEHCDDFEHIAGIACADDIGNEGCSFMIDESDGEAGSLQRDADGTP